MRTSHHAIVLTEEQRSQLETLVRSRTVERQIALSCRIILGAAAGASNQSLARSLNINRHTVETWRERFVERGLAGLKDAVRPGRPPRLGPEKMEAVITGVVRPPPGRARWSCRSMARQAGVSKSQVQRWWRANDLKPHLRRTFKLSNDKDFEQKFWDVIGLYLDPPEKALVLCCDEKGQCQALERTQPGLPLGIGHIRTKTHDYVRHGTLTLFAALNYLEGKLITRLAARHRHQEWLAFLKLIDQQTPADLAIHIIADNYATHKHPQVKKWLERHARFHMHYTPTSSSWMNLVERFFGDLTAFISEKSFASTRELADAIISF